MRAKSPMLLSEVASAAEFISEHTQSLSLDEYAKNELVRSAVERKFTIIGEVFLRLQESDRETVERISEYQKIIGFRHRLAHGYEDEIDNALVWQVIRYSLPVLSAEVGAILSESE